MDISFIVGVIAKGALYLGWFFWFVCEVLTNGTPDHLPNSLGEAFYWLILKLFSRFFKKPQETTAEPKPAITMDDLV